MFEVVPGVVEIFETPSPFQPANFAPKGEWIPRSSPVRSIALEQRLNLRAPQLRSAAWHPYRAKPPLTWHISADACLMTGIDGYQLRHINGRVALACSDSLPAPRCPCIRTVAQCARLAGKYTRLSALRFGAQSKRCVWAATRVSKSSEMCRRSGELQRQPLMGWGFLARQCVFLGYFTGLRLGWE